MIRRLDGAAPSTGHAGMPCHVMPRTTRVPGGQERRRLDGFHMSKAWTIVDERRRNIRTKTRLRMRWLQEVWNRTEREQSAVESVGT